MISRCASFAISLLCFTAINSTLSAAELKVLFPQARDAFQTNEVIDVSVVRTSPQALSAGDLQLKLTGADGSRLEFTFPVKAADVQNGSAQRTEHLHLNGWLLRPGSYSLEVASDATTAKADIKVYSHVRRSDFKLINWGSAKGGAQLWQGEDCLGYNVMYMSYGPQENANYIRAGVDYMGCCVMGGGHQMDLRLECDWSDPYVVKGGTQRAVRSALMDRLYPNAIGVHFYDEPGLTWSKDPETGEMVNSMVAAQHRSYVSAFGKDVIRYNKIDANNPDHLAQWNHWARWKLGLMDGAWADGKFGVERVKPSLLTATQSQYGYMAFSDGYYFTVVRSLPVISGHGGYHDGGMNYFAPSWYLEIARARDFARPNWYLPTWYADTTSDQMRCEQYLSFQTNIQGLITPPPCEPAVSAFSRDGIVESNLLCQKLGPIFNNMPVTKPPVAMLYSLSDAVRHQAKDHTKFYLGNSNQGRDLPYTYLAGKLLQQQFLVVLDEDVLDGTLINDHKALIITSVDYMDPPVIKELERFIANGGLVLLAGNCKVQITGAINLGTTPQFADQAKIEELFNAQKWEEVAPYITMGKVFQAVTPLAQAIKAQLDKKAILPFFESDTPSIAATRQAAGDVEYLFAVNGTFAEGNLDKNGKVDRNGLQATKATIGLADDGRPVYDAVLGGPVNALQSSGGKLKGDFRFGPGQMRVFARTAKPIKGVMVSTPIVNRDLVLDNQPVKLDITANVITAEGRILSGSVPLEVQVTDPLGVARYQFYRATKNGQFAVSLPLAANDPPGKWTVTVREMLNNTHDSANFEYQPPRAYSLAGSTSRAVIFPDDVDNIYRFGRSFNEVTIVTGNSPYCEAAATRLANALEPWGIRSKRMPLADAAKPRPVSADEATTWVGLVPGKVDPNNPSPAHVGFAVQGPVILLGTPEDNSIIDFLHKSKFLPYAPAAGTFPGVGRGYLAWQRDGVGKQQESITCIAYDEAGLNEAVGTLYEAVAGLKPLTRWEAAKTSNESPATSAGQISPSAKLVWETHLPDRVLAVRSAGDSLVAISHDGSSTTLDSQGHVVKTAEAEKAELAAGRKPLTDPPAETAKPFLRPDRLIKLVVPGDNRVAVAYWGGTLRIADPSGKVLAEQRLPQDITALTWAHGKLVAGLADGRLLALDLK